MSQRRGSTPLTSLPEALLEEIARHSLTDDPRSPPASYFGQDVAHHSQPLLGVSRATRDASLRGASRTALDLRHSTAASVQPAARLISRACSLAPALDLRIVSARERTDEQDRVVAAFHHASGQRGWHSVTSLSLQHTYFGPTSCYLLGPAFPNLRTLELWGVGLGQGGALASLQTCRQLSRLSVRSCTLDEAAVPGSAVLLSRLPSLRELVLGGHTPEALAQGVTQLTSLSFDIQCSDFSSLCNFAHQFSQLQHLNIDPDDVAEFCQPHHLQGLLLALTQLQSLEMHADIDQEGLDAALEHGRHLTKLTAMEMVLTSSRAHAACSLKALGWEGSISIESWAYLPLARMESLTVTSSEFGPHQLPGKEWWLPLQCRRSSASLPTLQLPSLMARAVSNILHCPAWAASGTGLTLGLTTGQVSAYGVTDVEMLSSSSTRLGAIRALAPLMPRVSHVSILMPGFTLGGPEVAALGEVGGPHITHLTLLAADVCSDFWPALWAHLPVLQTLTLAGCEGAVSGSISEVELAMFCVRAPRPLTLELDEQLYKDLGGARIEQSSRVRGAPQVTVKQVDAYGRPLPPAAAPAGEPGNVH